MVFLRRARGPARVFGFAALAGAAVLAAGCGGSSSSSGGGAGSSGQGKALTQAANAGGTGCKNVKRGGTLNFGVDQDVISFDAHNTQDNGSLWADMNIYDQLVELAPDAKKVVPGLAQSWVVSDGGKVYT